METVGTLLNQLRQDVRLGRDELMLLGEKAPLSALMACAQELTLAGHGQLVGYSRKVFIPLTRLCRNTCGYCTFATSPKKLTSAYLSPDEVLEIARAGAAQGCHEALFTLGERPELRYQQARQALAELGYATTLEYLAAMADLVYHETGLLPHINPGTMHPHEVVPLHAVSASLGIMLETTAQRLCEPGGAHWNCPDKHPQVRLDTLRSAGQQGAPITSGLLIGIGETRTERLEALLELRSLQEQYGHLQELIIQNFRAKPGTRMASAGEPDLDEQLWTIAMARLAFGSQMSIQAPPNLRPEALGQLLSAGVNDWGGISPVTLDHVNPEAAWPQIEQLAVETARSGRHLLQRLPLVPAFVREVDRWAAPEMARAIRRNSDSRGYARGEQWYPGSGKPLPVGAAHRLLNGLGPASTNLQITDILARAANHQRLTEQDIVTLFQAEGADLQAIFHQADALRQASCGDNVTFVNNCNINYTNICLFRCGFCAFAKGRTANQLRGPAYLLTPQQVAERAKEAWQQGAREVCMQGGIHPAFTGETYLSLVKAVKEVVPDMHVHAFSPLEIKQGAQTLGLSLHDYLQQLYDAGLRTLPGTAAEILDDPVRARLCSDKLSTQEWLEVMRTAHRCGIRSTATIMFGHLDTPQNWARHLLAIHDLQAQTGGFTEFVPLPFVHMESPIWHKGLARSGPTLRECLLMHAVSRLVLDSVLPNIQTSWVKMGNDGAALCLQVGANDLGGTLMYESITRAAGGNNGQLQTPSSLHVISSRCGRTLQQRDTLYRPISPALPPLTMSLTQNIPLVDCTLAVATRQS
ncbi:5-amino-6-(D-ribitylamino)uracil--L-tyrosine 4-hydroxyphenyl transferase CofH [Halopseudomonas phragmitis]|uniref:FO synthase n=1 Tax=Halopseudomonas phragmitis TaxID=1931241 RepID=A0A1V0B996_9GAMM|nr:5-amino-6-(D-ribitylamino)uracil--L-tyrosine 4-hydroxyphenyl transferase CofH [Halopseudomonas phragmitis]AQZ96487.1 7,8-didemethyl-8-hydroxy-5-deazariboflavin synthase [Halopseudomonas phragmitis]